jgi:hypothetical protein
MALGGVPFAGKDTLTLVWLVIVSLYKTEEVNWPTLSNVYKSTACGPSPPRWKAPKEPEVAFWYIIAPEVLGMREKQLPLLLHNAPSPISGKPV